MLAFDSPSASPVWPPTGIALALYLLLGRQYWPAIFVGAFIVNFTTAGTLVTSIAIAIGNTLEGLAGALLIERFVGGKRAFDHVDTVLRFALIAASISVLSASIGVAALTLEGFGSPNGIPAMWLTWWLGDTGGALLIAPLIIVWSTNTFVWWKNWRAMEAVTVFGILALVTLIFFSDAIIKSSIHYPLVAFCLLPVLWTAIRFGPRETIGIVLALSLGAIIGTVRGIGPFAVADANTSLILLQGFMIVASLIGLTLAAAMLERRISEDHLEQKVRDRTKELEHARFQDLANLQRLRSTIQHLPMAAILIDDQANVLELNEAYCKTFNIGLPAEDAKRLPNEELTEKFLSATLRPDGHMDNVNRALEKKEPLFDTEIHLKDGRIIVRDLLPIDEEGILHGFLFLYRDVTRERRTDRAKSEFMSLASHQLRTPLTAMRWSLSHLKKNLSGLSELDETFLEEGQRAVARMTETIDTMLKIARIEADNTRVEMVEENVREILDRKAHVFRPQYEAKNQLLIVECPDVFPIVTDITFLREILTNLIQNAIKYTPDEGKIFLRARREAGRVMIEVEDTGFGIPEHQHKLVFQKFFRGDNVVDRDSSGTGLGLYLVSLLTKALHGTIEMRSDEGQGTLFTLSFPDLASAKTHTVPGKRTESIDQKVAA